ncbi:MAG: transposase [Syntrophales bacterium]|nr:transposase [Syntrophales bacterium]
MEEELDPLTEKQQEFVRVIELAEIQKHMIPYRWQGIGRKREDRLAIVKAFVAKAVYNFPTTKVLIAYLHDSTNLRRLCGWESKGEIPSESTFSRAFEEFSRGGLGQKIHEAMVKQHAGPKLAGHVSRDATAIEAREKPFRKELKPPKSEPKCKRGRPRRGEVRAAKEPKRLDLQLGRSLEDNVANLPTWCDVGTKIDAKGHKTSWIGYKLHIDSIDGDIPVSAVLSSASLHDSQAAIPLAQMTAGRITSLYDLMDKAYDAPQIRSYSAELGHVPIIDTNPRRGEKKEMDPAQAVRFRNRSTAERVNSNLKDNYGGRFVRVRGAAKVMTHLMFGLIAITAMQLFRLLE